jgi:hypothetical protein
MSPADAIRDLLLAPHLLAAVPEAPRALQQRVYRAAVAVVPPSMGAMRAVGVARSASDEALVAAFGGGDAGAFETLVQRHLAWMVAWARQHLPPADAEDAAQEAFLALVHKAAALQLHSTLRGYPRALRPAVSQPASWRVPGQSLRRIVLPRRTAPALWCKPKPRRGSLPP